MIVGDFSWHGRLLMSAAVVSALLCIKNVLKTFKSLW